MKIEKCGGYAARTTIPTVRLKGKWLQTARFLLGRYIALIVIAAGVIELRVVGGAA